MIPTYNQAGVVAKAVESALKQDYPNLAVLVADDGSTDSTETVLAPFIEQGTIQYYKNQPNIGRVANYRKCLYEYAQADWVLNLDGDDYLTNPLYLRQAMESITHIGQDEVLFYQGVHIYKTTNREKVYQTNVQGMEVIAGQDYFFDFFRRKHFSHMSALYKRQMALDSGFYEKNAISADIYSFMQFALNNPTKKIILSNAISGVWLQHSENASQNIHLQLYRDNFKLYQQLYQKAKRNGYSWWSCISWWGGALKEIVRMYMSVLVKRLIK